MRYSQWDIPLFAYTRTVQQESSMTNVLQGMTPDRISQRKAKLAAWLREGLVRLGPTFIKIGQQFSTRVDVLAPEFVKELEKLQVRSPASLRHM